MSPRPDASAVLPMSRFRWVGDRLVTSGLAAIDVHGVLDGPFTAQLDHILAQFADILGSQGLDVSDVVSVNVFLLTMDDYPRLNEAFLRFFTPPFPVRTTIACGLFPGLSVEMSMTARASRAAL